MLDARRTRLAGGAATLLSSHAEHPRPATSDTTKGGQATPADSLKESQLAARSGPSPRRRTSPTTESKQQALQAPERLLEAGRLGGVQLPDQANANAAVRLVVFGEGGLRPLTHRTHLGPSCRFVDATRFPGQRQGVNRAPARERPRCCRRWCRRAGRSPRSPDGKPYLGRSTVAPLAAGYVAIWGTFGLAVARVLAGGRAAGVHLGWGGGQPPLLRPESGP
jgi:hypothetical protein